MALSWLNINNTLLSQCTNLIVPTTLTPSPTSYIGIGTITPLKPLHITGWLPTCLNCTTSDPAIRLEYGSLVSSCSASFNYFGHLALTTPGNWTFYSTLTQAPATGTAGDIVLQAQTAKNILLTTRQSDGFIKFATTNAPMGPDIERMIIAPSGNVGIRNTTAGIGGNLSNYDPKNLFQISSLLGFDNPYYNGIAHNDLVQDIRFNCYENSYSLGQYTATTGGHSALISFSVNDPGPIGTNGPPYGTNGFLHIGVSPTNTAGTVFDFVNHIPPGQSGYSWYDGIQLRNYDCSGRTGIGLNSEIWPNTSVSVMGWTTDNTASAFVVNNIATDGTQRLFSIANDGHIGIASPSMTQRLLVRGLNHGSSATTTNLELTDNIGNTKFIVKDNGNIGINNSAPGSNLFVKANDLQTSVFNVTNSSDVSLLNVINNGNVGINNSAPGSNLLVKANDLQTTVFNATNSSDVSLLNVINNGNVGINNSAPGSNLLVKANNAQTSVLNVTNSSDVSLFFVGNDGKIGINYSSSDALLTIRGLTSVNTNLNVTDNNGVSIFKVNENGTVQSNGIIQIGDGTGSNWVQQDHTDARLFVKGIAVIKELYVKTDNWSDFVLDKKYKLPEISELEQQIINGGHLPGVPTEKEVKEKGINVAEMDAILLQKIEELYLYIFQLKKEIERLKDGKGK